MLFAESEIPQSPTDVLMLPLIILFFGAVVYAAAYAKGMQVRKLPMFRFIGVALIVIAIFLGFQSFWQLQDALYKASIGKRVLYAHYLGFFFPLLCAIAVGVMEFLFRRRGNQWE